MSLSGEVTAPPRPPLPPLPLELWTRVIACVTKPSELGGIWLTVRRVSRLLKAATEAAFVQRHLRAFDITYRLGHAYIDEEDAVEAAGCGHKCTLAVTCRFDRLSEDGERAFFADRDFALDPEGSPFKAKVRLETRNAWREAVAMYLGDGGVDRRYDMPPHIVWLGRMVMDTDLPELRADFDAFEISFKWKEALSLFFGELAFIRAIEWLEIHEKEDQIADLRGKHERGDISFYSLLVNGMSMIENMADKVQQRVRRLRFRRWYERHGSPLPAEFFEEEEYEEREKLRELREARTTADWTANEEEEEDDDDEEEPPPCCGDIACGGTIHPYLDKQNLGLDYDAYYGHYDTDAVVTPPILRSGFDGEGAAMPLRQ